MFLKEHHFDLSITDFESFVRRVDTSKKGRIDIDDFKYFLAPNDSQLASNYSSIGRDNTRFDLGKSVVDSFSSPLRQLAAGPTTGPGPFNIHIHEIHHHPANISAISPRSHHQHQHSSPPKLFSPGNKNFMSKIDLIQAQEERLNRQFDSRPTYQIEERRESRHGLGGSPTRQVVTRTSHYSPTKQTIVRTTTYSPARNERETATFFSGRVGSIRENYQSRPQQAYNSSSNLESIRRTYGLPENSARSTAPQGQPPLAYSTLLQKDLPPYTNAVSHAVSQIPSSRIGYEYRSSSIQPRLPTAGDYQDLPGQRLSHQRPSHDRRLTTEGRETLSRSPLRNSRPSARLYEMKTQSYVSANLPPKYDIYAQDKGESLSRPSYTRPDVPLSYKSGAASRYLTSGQNYASGSQIRSSSPGLAGGYASRLSGGYDSKQYSTAYGGSIRTNINTAFANATEGMRREEPITSHIKTEPARFSNVESQIESRRKARDNVANGGSGIKASGENVTSYASGIGGIGGIGAGNITSSVSGIGGIRDNFTSSVGIRDNYTSSIGGIGGAGGALTREHLVSSGSGVKRETYTSSIGGGVAGRISPNHLAGSANKNDYATTSPLYKQEPLIQEVSAGGSIQDQIEKRQKQRDGYPAGKNPSSLLSYTGTSPVRDPYFVSQLETINETREGGIRYSPPRLEVENKAPFGGYSTTSYQINEKATYPYPKSAASNIQETATVTKTEGDQPAYSSAGYKFSNQRYEQLWSQ